MTRLRLYWETLRHLRPSQLAWQLVRRVAPLPRHRPVAAEPRRPGLGVRPFAPPVVPAVGPGEIAFLHLARPLDPAAPDWAAADLPKLWRYNLHYFDFLHWPVYPAALRDQLIASWIAAHPVPAGDGWEPYPLSLRTVNWIKYWLARDGATVDAAALASLATQLAGLATRIEHHLLANHLLKNGKALFFGGCFLTGPRADRWRAEGLAILLREADEQVLPDGGHFERSPLYHAIVLEDLLDVVNLARACPGLVPGDAEQTLVAAATRALRFFAGTLAGDGRIPLFNDAAFGIAPEPADLLAYGARVLGVGAGASPAIIDFPHTGYYGYRAGGESLIVDCGEVGPDYQPGHAHCDTLSYELCVDGQRVVVDAGVYGYEADDWRHYVRRTASHNTVTVDDEEQSVIWGAFRVAARARPLTGPDAPTLTGTLDGGLTFTGGHDGYRRLPDRPVHKRTVRMPPGGPWEVTDLVSGTGSRFHRVTGYVHFDPALEVEAGPDGAFMVRNPATGLMLRLSVTGDSLARLESGYHFPEFGLRRANKIMIIEREGKLPLEMHYRIERQPPQRKPDQ